MDTLRVYVDTSVFGGTCDDEFADPSRRFFREASDGAFRVIVSPEVLRELQYAPEPVRAVLGGLPGHLVESVAVDQGVLALARAYVDAGILGDASFRDAVHVAAATVAGADVIVSWNFQHIVNLNRILKYNEVNAAQGYSRIEIRSPAEMAYGDQEEDI